MRNQLCDGRATKQDRQAFPGTQKSRYTQEFSEVMEIKEDK